RRGPRHRTCRLELTGTEINQPDDRGGLPHTCGAHFAPRTGESARRRSRAMRNIWTICRRELYSYFVSPIAWVLLAIFAFLSGVFTYIISASFVRYSLEGQMNGQSGPMNVNEQVIAPLFSNIAVVGLFLIPLISMRLFAEEKR